MGHSEIHPLAGKTIRLNLAKAKNVRDPDNLDGAEYRLEDWWDREMKSWMDCIGNPAAMKYGIRSGLSGLPFDDEVVYGKVGILGHIIHVSELGDVIEK